MVAVMISTLVAMRRRWENTVLEYAGDEKIPCWGTVYAGGACVTGGNSAVVQDSNTFQQLFPCLLDFLDYSLSGGIPVAAYETLGLHYLLWSLLHLPAAPENKQSPTHLEPWPPPSINWCRNLGNFAPWSHMANFGGRKWVSFASPIPKFWS